MTPPVEHTTSVQLAFKASSSSPASSNVSATLIDKRNHLHINLVPNMNTFVSAQVHIDHLPATNSSTLKQFSLKPGHNYIGTSDTVGMTDIRYDFEDGKSYSIKIICLSKESGSTPSSVLSYYSYRTTETLFDNLESYSFLFRSNGGSGDSFSNAAINNPSDIENGSDIIISCPLDLEPQRDADDNAVLDGSGNPVFVDTRKPHHLLFTFDEEDTYDAVTGITNPPTLPNSDNTEQLAEYSAYLPYESNGIYTLTSNTLKNDAVYVVSVSGIYSDGHVISTTILKRVHVITSPVIESVIAYGIDKASVPGPDQLEGEEPSVSTVMNVFLTSQSSPMNVQEANDKITFYLSQKNSNNQDVVRYSSEVDVSTTVVGGLIKYTILNDVTDETKFVPVNEPEAGNNTYDVYCILEYKNLNDGDANIFKRSNVISATFTADINSLPQDFFGINNAWVAASVTTDEGGRRQVDLENAVSADGYTAAPAFGIVGEFRKNDYYGSGNTVNELFKDLDLVDTQHKFMLGKENAEEEGAFNYTPVNYLYQMQEDVNKTSQENYVDLMKKQMIYEQNGAETVLTDSQVASVKVSSNNIISSSPSGTAENGWSILNTGVNTNGATGGALPKVNLYFYGNATSAASQTTNNSFKMSQASGLGLYAIFYQNSGAKEYPFFNVYTTTTGNVADRTINKASWYKSRIFYSSPIPTAEGNTVVNPNLVGLTLVYTGTDDSSLFADIPSYRRVKYEMSDIFSDKFPGSDNELVNLISLQTSSNATTSSAGNFNFRLLETGLVTSHATFGKVALRYNQPKPRLLYSADGLFPNIPDSSSASGVTNWGTEQPRILFWIPQNNMYVQQNAVKVSIAIIAPVSVLPPETESNNYSIVVHKVNRYEMTIGTSSEPRFTGSGSSGVLEVPINNPTTDDNDYYFNSATFVSNASDNVTEQQTANGIFDLTVTNPSIRGVGTTCDYKVYYTISDPNGDNIDGPLSEQYSINLKDEPTDENFEITAYTYKTFNVDGESSFQFTVTFSDGGETSIDGLRVYFVSDNGDNISSNNINETLVKEVSRKIEGVETDVQTISVMLQSTGSESGAATDGVKINDIDENLSANTWLNFRSGTLRFRPYHTPQVVNSDDERIETTAVDHEEVINNIPVIDPVDHESVSLVGGVIESHKVSVMEWTNDLSQKYGTISTVVTAVHNLTVNSNSETANINEGSSSYNISLFETQPTDYTLSLTVKVVAVSDASEYWSAPVVLVFGSVSVDQTPMTITVKRGSNHQTLKMTRGNYTSSPTPTLNLNVTKVELVNNPDGNDNQDPEKSNVVIIPCTSTSNAIQPTGSEQSKNSYNISSYTFGDVLQLVYRVEAGVKYTVSSSARDSEPLYLTLYANSLPYRVASIPSIDIDSQYNVKSSSDADNGQMSMKLSINAKGLAEEGLTGVVIVLAQEGDFTTENDGDANGASASLIFNSSQVVTYEVSAEAASANNMNVGETFEFTDSNGHTWRLVAGDLDGGSTNSVLYFPSGMNDGTLNGGFNNTKDLLAVGIASTRLGTAATDGFLDISPNFTLISSLASNATQLIVTLESTVQAWNNYLSVTDFTVYLGPFGTWAATSVVKPNSNTYIVTFPKSEWLVSMPADLNVTISNTRSGVSYNTLYIF